MSDESDLARVCAEALGAIAIALYDYADRKDAADGGAMVGDETLPAVSDTATSQRAILAVLETAPDDGLTAREIANQADVTQFNVYEKLDRLGTMGYVENVPL